MPGDARIQGGLLPRLSDINAEFPGLRHIVFAAAESAGHFIVRSVVTMRIDGRRTRLQPDSRRNGAAGNALTNNSRRVNP